VPECFFFGRKWKPAKVDVDDLSLRAVWQEGLDIHVIEAESAGDPVRFAASQGGQHSLEGVHLFAPPDGIDTPPGAVEPGHHSG